METSEVRSSPPITINQIHVEELFGRLNYDIEAPLDSSRRSRLLILYGDNGCGKTTLMTLVFHLLSPADSRGHRTQLARTVFKKIEVLLSDGSSVMARRDETGHGPFLIKVKRRRSDPIVFKIGIDSEGRVSSTSFPRSGELSSVLRSLDLNIFFLADDRRFRADFLQESSDRRSASSRPARAIMSEDTEKILDEIRRNQVEKALSKTASIFREQLLSASDQGEVTTESIYREIVQSLAQLSFEYSDEGATLQRGEFLSLIETARSRGSDFAEMGIRSGIVSDELVEAVRTANEKRYREIYAVLSPFVRSLSARLDAMDPTRKLIATLLDSVNEFLSDKSLTFDIRHGLRVILDAHIQRRWLPSDALSSGERQLLLIFCYALHARSEASVFMIDEPEISLNIKWQRRLLASLLDCVHGSGVQLVIATHSIPLISDYRDWVAQMTQKNNGEEQLWTNGD